MKDYARTNRKKNSRIEALKHVVEVPGVPAFFKSLVFTVSMGLIVVIVGHLIYRSNEEIAEENIVIRGNDVIPTKIIREYLNLSGLSLSDADTYDIAVNAQKFPWVKSAETKLLYPDTVLIKISEKKPIAFYRVPKHIYLLDDNLTVLPPLFNQSGWDLPVISDLSIKGAIKPGEIIGYPPFTAAIELMDSIKKSDYMTLDMVSDIDISDMFDIRLKTFGRHFLIHMGSKDFAVKLNNLYYALPEIQKLKTVNKVDLRYKNKVIVK